MEMAWRDVVFQYDGTFEGFLCCVFESYVNKEFPIAFSGDEECWSLYEVRYVVTEREHAQRVYQSILRRSKPRPMWCGVAFSPAFRRRSAISMPWSRSFTTRDPLFSAIPPIRCTIP